jgi:hypothetical protein
VKKEEPVLKNPDLNKLNDYVNDPGQKFWDSFPKNHDLTVKTSVNIEMLESEIKTAQEYMTISEKRRANRAVLYLKKGAPSYQKEPLPACSVENSISCYIHGAYITDTIADWIKKDFVAGPYSEIPLLGFRSNSLLAVVQPGKIRPVLNISLPKDESFNSNVKEHLLEKVHMATAKSFSFAVRDAGRGARMSKFDMRDAYKTVPAPLPDLRLQGFEWLNCYFIEKKQIFGAKTAVANFDTLGNTLKCLTLSKCKIDPNLVHRCLDDVPIVSPANTNHCESFTVAYKELCAKVDVKLADDCPKLEKAFSNSTQGKVLGVWFNTNDLTWSFPLEKTSKLLSLVNVFLQKDECSLKETQELMGRLNDFAQLMPFMKFFNKPLNDMLRDCYESPSGKSVVSEVVKNDLWVWAACILGGEGGGYPICSYYYAPPLRYKSFASDAAGVPFTAIFKENTGVGCIGFNEQGEIISAFQYFWKFSFVAWKDSKGAEMGSKTTTLEMIGLLCNVLLNIDVIRNQHVVLLTDNIACYYGWISRSVKEDITASILIRCIGLLAAFVGSQFHVVHLPRLSNWEGQVVDRLSRSSTTTRWDRNLLASFKDQRLPRCLELWLESPSEDWSLPVRLLNEISV